jgi:hypothetical protein
MVKLFQQFLQVYPFVFLEWGIVGT